MNDEDVENLKESILKEIDMLLYAKHNHKIATMYAYLGVAYTYKDIDEAEQLEKEDRKYLLKEVIKVLQKELLGGK